MKRPDPAILRLILFCGALLGALLVLILFRDIFQPLLLGLLVAYLFDPAVSALGRLRLSRTSGVVLLSLLLLVAGAALLLIVVPAVSDQVRSAAERLPEYGRRLREQFEPVLERLRARYPEQIDQLRTSLVEAARANWTSLATVAGTVMGSTFSSLLGVLLFLLNLVFVPVFAFYLLVDFPRVKAGVSELIPLPYRPAVLARLREVDESIASFLRGQLTIALILAGIYSVGLMLLGVPLGLVIGIVAGLANMVPYMALVVGLVPALLLCWAEYASGGRLLGVLGVFGAAQLLEGLVLSPRILSASVNLHPVWVLLSILAGGNLFGFFGMLLAVPVAAAIQVFARSWVQAYKASRVYGGTPAEAGAVPSSPAPAAGGPAAAPTRPAETLSGRRRRKRSGPGAKH
jgi:predicted PurR-regulated permease PerM